MNLEIVVVTHNSADHLTDALDGLPADTTVVVVDNASSDGSAAIAARSGARVVENGQNAGFGTAANQGARLGDNDLILFLNPDAVIAAADLEVLASTFDDQPDLGIVSPHVVYTDGTRQRVTWPIPTARNAWIEALGLRRLLGRRTAPSFVIGACFLIRRALFEKLGGFDERFWLYGEEAELCARALDQGWQVAEIESAAATHIGGASGAAVPDLVFEHFNRGAEHLVAKREGRGGLVSLRMAEAVGSVIRATAHPAPERRAYHRNRLRRLRGVLAKTPLSVPLESPATGTTGAGLIVCSLEAWDDIWRRNQFFVRELLELDPNRRVLYVEPPYDWVHEGRHRTARPRHRGLRPLDADGRIVRLEPYKMWPRLLGPFADRSLRRQVRLAASRLGFDRPSLWVNDPSYAGLATETRWPAVYDITDDWTEAGEGTRASARVTTNETRLFAECGSVVVCSEGLAETRRPRRSDLVLIPNAVDVDHLTRPQSRPADLPTGPVALYVGTLHEDRLDVDLVEHLADKLPDLNVVLIGPDALGEEAVGKFSGHTNIHRLGARPYSEVPGYLQHADIVIVPHVVTAFTESLDPIKAYECLAVGRPAVATPVAGFRDLGDPVRTVERDDFVDAVKELAAEWISPQRRPVPSWADRAERFAEELDRARSTRPRLLRVAYIDHCAQLSGAELALARLLPALEGVEAHVILGEHGPLEAVLREGGATVEVLALDERVSKTHRGQVTPASIGIARAVALGRDTWALSRRLRELEVDIVHTNSLKAAVYGGVAGRLAGVPVVWHVRDRIASDYLPSPAVAAIRTLARVLPRWVIANSAATLSTLGHHPRASVVASPLGPVMVESSGSNVGDGPLRIAMVGRLAPWKGQHIFLEAFAAAFPDGPARAVIAGTAMFGEDDYADELQDQATRLNIADRVDFAGFVEDVPALLGQSDILVHASTTPEPFGQVIIEGMAAGLPVIATDAGGPAEIITAGVDGLLVPAGDAATLAEVMGELAGDGEERLRLGQNARRSSHRFDAPTIAGAVLEVYDRMGRIERNRVGVPGGSA